MALTLNDLKNLSPQMKALIIGVVFILIGYFFWFLYLDSAMATKDDLDKKLQALTKEVDEKEGIARQKDQYIKEVQALKEIFQMALTKLPDQKEIPGLFLAVAQAGRDAGVEFILFEPRPPEQKVTQAPGANVKAALKPSDQRAEQKPADPKAAEAAKKPAAKQEPQFSYEEIPVKVTVNGGFHSTAVFFDKVAKLPRIVNIDEIAMGEGKDVRGRGRMINSSFMIKTYMFQEKKDEKKK